ncbi:MAG TPA: 50S ribosomal protein L5 [Kiritimatiellia bacterium]|jgi:large subunit ribosomal protein L5|nr:50S ribosomal protein L5 [Kiritimatiellia bacterium]HOR97505.1 50S ribosomal protein L5 [Kiritimatiellia bacterium]HPW75360.1 50S ribosomal protein L5 [Kiritimatiellia bacterium]
MARLKETFAKEMVPKLQEKLGIKNKMLVPRLQKVVLNMAFGIVEKDVQKTIVDDLAKLSGQKPVLCKARKSISNFKLREGMVIGAKVTLRGDRMFDFMERLVNSALPRIRDFRGVPSRGFDGRGNYTLGLKEHTIFPEMIDSGTPGADVGMDITFVTSAKDNQGARELLGILGMPFTGK